MGNSRRHGRKTQTIIRRCDFHKIQRSRGPRVPLRQRRGARFRQPRWRPNSNQRWWRRGGTKSNAHRGHRRRDAALGRGLNARFEGGLQERSPRVQTHERQQGVGRARSIRASQRRAVLSTKCGGAPALPSAPFNGGDEEPPGLRRPSSRSRSAQSHSERQGERNRTRRPGSSRRRHAMATLDQAHERGLRRSKRTRWRGLHRQNDAPTSR